VKWIVRSITLALFIAVCSAFETTASAAIILGNLPASNEQPGADIGDGSRGFATFELESALVENAAPGNYTAIVRGVNNGVGNALVEVYNLQ
jgi:hypothetical protein